MKLVIFEKIFKSEIFEKFVFFGSPDRDSRGAGPMTGGDFRLAGNQARTWSFLNDGYGKANRSRPIITGSVVSWPCGGGGTPASGRRALAAW